MENVAEDVGDESRSQMSRERSGDEKLEDIPAADAEILDDAIMEEDLEDPLDI
jgi:hypothetical protein